jgi:hypothetical protein
MKGKPIRVDWEELESAFENKTEDLVYYLDLVTGDVVLEGEGEEALDDPGDYDDDLEEVVPVRRDQSTRLYIEPPDPETEAGWMTDFVETAKDANPAVLAVLREALDKPDPVEAFREVLRHHGTERDRWFLFRSDRIHDTIGTWLDENGVKSTEPPPWKS